MCADHSRRYPARRQHVSRPNPKPMTDDLTSNEVVRTPKRSERLRQRAAWMYFVEEMTQSAIADTLGVGRVTVVRMLAEAKALGEVRVALSRGDAELGGLEAELMQKLRIVRRDRCAAVLRHRRSDGADRGGARRPCFGAAAQRYEDRARVGTHAEHLARIFKRALAERSERRVSGRRRHAFRGRQPGGVSLRLRPRLQRGLLPHSLSLPSSTAQPPRRP